MSAKTIAPSTIEWLTYVDGTHPHKNQIVNLVWNRIHGFVSEQPESRRLYLNSRGQAVLDAAREA